MSATQLSRPWGRNSGVPVCRSPAMARFADPAGEGCGTWFEYDHCVCWCADAELRGCIVQVFRWLRYNLVNESSSSITTVSSIPSEDEAHICTSVTSWRALSNCACESQDMLRSFGRSRLMQLLVWRSRPGPHATMNILVYCVACATVRNACATCCCVCQESSSVFTSPLGQPTALAPAEPVPVQSFH